MIKGTVSVISDDILHAKTAICSNFVQVTKRTNNEKSNTQKLGNLTPT